MKDNRIPGQGDTALVLDLIKHRQTPCVPAGTGCTSARFYDETAKKVLPELVSPCAIGILRLELLEPAGYH